MSGAVYPPPPTPTNLTLRRAECQKLPLAYEQFFTTNRSSLDLYRVFKLKVDLWTAF